MTMLHEREREREREIEYDTIPDTTIGSSTFKTSMNG